ncbi:putative O-methyltransferase [Bimuria novae-zelandiae CBS 107.79]|uniref:Putative O-methyltransferase n=1 Tax=Bimuria novae-zelandiae CBS 107.79 TaxID=1447943 RepID=A0A6A5VXQ5_9PLEO|nr:putative O-methyltransferase [Bimuria novae-zelandiae CBS 107.79]
MSPLVELAEKILANAKKVDAYTNTDKSQPIPAEVQQARVDLLDASHELKKAVVEPESWLNQLYYGYTDIVALRAVYTLKLPHHVPLEGDISYEEVAKASNVNEQALRRLFYYAITINLFTETRPNHVAHSATSRHLVNVPGAFDALGMKLEELVPASQKSIEALQRWPQATEPTETGYNIAHGTDLPFYRALAQQPERARRFGNGMRYFTDRDNCDLSHLVAAFPWQEHDKPDFTVVDVGGGQGGVSMRLASDTKNMHFIVQDLEGTVKHGEEVLPAELKGRVEFMTHDFFSPQKVFADVYFFRWILHNWSDKYCVDILRSLIPALKSGARVLLYEYEREDAPETKLSRKDANYLDMVMLSCWNGAIRTESDWNRLFAATDARLVLKGITRPPGSAMSLIEAVWTAEKVADP